MRTLTSWFPLPLSFIYQSSPRVRAGVHGGLRGATVEHSRETRSVFFARLVVSCVLLCLFAQNTKCLGVLCCHHASGKLLRMIQSVENLQVSCHWVSFYRSGNWQFFRICLNLFLAGRGSGHLPPRRIFGKICKFAAGPSAIKFITDLAIRRVSTQPCKCSCFCFPVGTSVRSPWSAAKHCWVCFWGNLVLSGGELEIFTVQNSRNFREVLISAVWVSGFVGNFFCKHDNLCQFIPILTKQIRQGPCLNCLVPFWYWQKQVVRGLSKWRWTWETARRLFGNKHVSISSVNPGVCLGNFLSSRLSPHMSNMSISICQTLLSVSFGEVRTADRQHEALLHAATPHHCLCN